jgi:hypothetical protein
MDFTLCDISFGCGIVNMLLLVYPFPCNQSSTCVI